MKKNIAFIIIGLLITYNSHIQGQSQKKLDWSIIVNKVQEKIEFIMDNYQILWPSGYTNFEVQFSNGSDGWLITPEKVEKYHADNKPAFQNTRLGYSKVEHSEKSILQVVITEEILNLYFPKASPEKLEEIAINFIDTYIFHEAFHYFVQDPSTDWKKELDGESSRATVYPSNSTPRIYRNHIYELLIKAYMDAGNAEKYLAQAKYWYDKYQEEFASEAKAIAYTDRNEGTARYVEYMSDLLFTHGLDLSKEEIQSKIREVKANYQVLSSPSTESYEIGFIAGVILDEIDTSWKERMHYEGGTPLSLLFEHIVAVREEPAMEVDYIHTLDSIASQINAEMKPVMDKLQTVYKGENPGELLLIPKKAKGSFQTSGIYRHADIDGGYEIINGYRKTLKNNEGEIQIKGIPAFQMPLDHKCKYEGFAYILLDEDAKENITINMKTRKTKNDKGQTILCVCSYEEK